MVYSTDMDRLAFPLIVVDWNAVEPVYVQIARQVRAQIASGQLPAGMNLPSVRTMASDLGVNLNTVARAYRILEEEGFVVIRDRAGAVVAPPGQVTDESTIAGLAGELGSVLARMRQAGLSIEELRRRVERELAGLAAGGHK